MSQKKRYKALKAFETTSTKACPKCLKIKSLADFSPQSTGRKGLKSRCKVCRLEYERKRRFGNDTNAIKRFELREQENEDEKVCGACLTIKPLSAFHKCKRGSTRKGHHSICKQCVSEKSKAERIHNPQVAQRRNLKRNYGLTVKQYDEMLKGQGGCCDICGTDIPGHMGRFVVDHNHETGQVRALLCNQCNTALGFFKDNPETLRTAAEYLEKHNE